MHATCSNWASVSRRPRDIPSPAFALPCHCRSLARSKLPPPLRASCPLLTWQLDRIFRRDMDPVGRIRARCVEATKRAFVRSEDCQLLQVACDAASQLAAIEIVQTGTAKLLESRTQPRLPEIPARGKWVGRRADERRQIPNRLQCRAVSRRCPLLTGGYLNSIAGRSESRPRAGVSGATCRQHILDTGALCPNLTPCQRPCLRQAAREREWRSNPVLGTTRSWPTGGNTAGLDANGLHCGS